MPPSIGVMVSSLFIVRGGLCFEGAGGCAYIRFYNGVSWEGSTTLEKGMLRHKYNHHHHTTVAVICKEGCSELV